MKLQLYFFPAIFGADVYKRYIMTGTDGFGGQKCRDACIVEPECECFDFIHETSQCTLTKKPDPFLLQPNNGHDSGCVQGTLLSFEMTEFVENSKISDNDVLRNPDEKRMTKADSAEDCKQMCLYDIDCACFSYKTSEKTCSFKLAEGYSIISSKDHTSGCRNGGLIKGYALYEGDVMNK